MWAFIHRGGSGCQPWLQITLGAFEKYQRVGPTQEVLI